VVARVVDAFVESEVKRRADIITAGVNTLRQLEADGKKIRPDVNHVDENGATVTSLYTPQKQKELKANREKVEKLDQALAKVLESHTADAYTKLEEAIKKSSQKGGGQQQQSEADAA
jgi:murein L,D-transpeptidase YcbB/YkuD